MTHRVAILGAGKLGRTHARHWATIPEAQVVAILDTHRDIAQDVGVGAGYDDLGALLRETQPDIIDICTPTPSHRAYVAQAAAAGAAIFVEKPLARTLEDCDTIVRAVEQAGVPLMAGHVVRYFPAYRAAKRIVEDGGVGTPTAVRAERLAGFPHRGSAQSWYADPAQSGGVVLDAMLHDFDWVRWCFGPVIRVHAQGLYGRPEFAGLLDYALVTLRFASGTVGHVAGSWAHSGPMKTGFEIAGDGGLVDFDSSRSVSLSLTPNGGSGGGPESPLSAEDDPYYQELRAFVDALDAKAPMPVTVYDAREAVRIALAALESIETGRPVTLS
jgi:UDP-N-acetylglucosamine 3-dehydrogenase